MALKNSIVGVMAALTIAVTVTSCSVYSCPTYTKAAKPQSEKRS